MARNYDIQSGKLEPFTLGGKKWTPVTLDGRAYAQYVDLYASSAVRAARRGSAGQNLRFSLQIEYVVGTVTMFERGTYSKMPADNRDWPPLVAGTIEELMELADLLERHNPTIVDQITADIWTDQMPDLDDDKDDDEDGQLDPLSGKQDSSDSGS